MEMEVRTKVKRLGRGGEETGRQVKVLAEGTLVGTGSFQVPYVPGSQGVAAVPQRRGTEPTVNWKRRGARPTRRRRQAPWTNPQQVQQISAGFVQALEVEKAVGKDGG